MSERIAKLEEELVKLTGTVTGMQATVLASERRLMALEARADKTELEQKNHSRWLQEFSEKLAGLRSVTEAMDTKVRDMQSFVHSKADQLLREYHDTIQSPPPDQDKTEEITLTDIKRPARE